MSKQRGCLVLREGRENLSSDWIFFFLWNEKPATVFENPLIQTLFSGNFPLFLFPLLFPWKYSIPNGPSTRSKSNVLNFQIACKFEFNWPGSEYGNTPADLILTHGTSIFQRSEIKKFKNLKKVVKKQSSWEQWRLMQRSHSEQDSIQQISMEVASLSLSSSFASHLLLLLIRLERRKGSS